MIKEEIRKRSIKFVFLEWWGNRDVEILCLKNEDLSMIGGNIVIIFSDLKWI